MCVCVCVVCVCGGGGGGGGEASKISRTLENTPEESGMPTLAYYPLPSTMSPCIFFSVNSDDCLDKLALLETKIYMTQIEPV